MMDFRTSSNVMLTTLKLKIPEENATDTVQHRHDIVTGVTLAMLRFTTERRVL
jgi:hypothetical protein